MSSRSNRDEWVCIRSNMAGTQHLERRPADNQLRIVYGDVVTYLRAYHGVVLNLATDRFEDVGYMPW